MADCSQPNWNWVSLHKLLVCCCFFFFLLCSVKSAESQEPTTAKRKQSTYIIQMEKSAMPISVFSSQEDWYSTKLQSVISAAAQMKSVASFSGEEEQTTTREGSGDAKRRILYTYQHSFHGLAAKLTPEEVELLQAEDGVLTVFPETVYQLHTTRSPLFLGIVDDEDDDDDDDNNNNNLSYSASGDNNHDLRVWAVRDSDHDVIVGILDTGIWPESPSFSDSGIASPAPRRWRGVCEPGRGFSPRQHCNRKIVGARIFYRGYEAAVGGIDEGKEHKSPRDTDGHGTHTAATVAGAPVKNANLLGYAGGTARGMAPGARVAAYKVCWSGGCFSSDILSAVDAAVADGVDVLSISLGGGVNSYYRDSLSVATFGAMEKGVLVSCSAGNGGPDPISLANVAPWVVTVGASTMDRDFPAALDLGSGQTLIGSSIYKGKQVLSPKRQYPLFFPGSGSGNSSSLLFSSASSPDPSSLCLEGTLNPDDVRGKIVICDRGISPRVQKGQVVKEAGGVGMVLANTAENGEELVADCHLLPAVAVGEKEGNLIKRYAAAGGATATLRFLGTRTGVKPSPVVAAFSSRGPSMISLEIMKPDVIAPGVNILAAWTGAAGPSGTAADRRRVGFNVLSGTSMSAPHVSGVAALIRARHPEWSPAAIKSALMTTAYVNERAGKRPIIDAATGGPSGPYQHGSGHIDPVKALDPGLVYDISPQEYFDFLCSEKLTPVELKVFSEERKCTRRTISSTTGGGGGGGWVVNPGDLNYPAVSFVFPASSNKSVRLSVKRTVTNVGPAISSYHVAVSRGFKGVAIEVEPKVLNFSRKVERIEYTVSVKSMERQREPQVGHMVWKDHGRVHRVRSPILVTWELPI